MTTRHGTYAIYSAGCAGVWAAILLVARRLDSEARRKLQLVCGGWWMGWTSATIARIGLPPPKPLSPASEARLRKLSIVLTAIGLMNVVGFLLTRKRPARGQS
jgi:hypothetical protein